MRIKFFGLIVAAALLMASPAMASLTYIYGGADITGHPAAFGTAAEAFTAFSSQFATIQTETFEGFGGLLNQTNHSLPTAFGTITSGDAGYIGSTATLQATYDETPLAGSQYYFSNGTPGQAQPKGDFTLNLNVAHHALGFYATDWHDQGGTVILDISGKNGDGTRWTESINVLDLTGTMASGSLTYFAFLSDLAFDTVVFYASDGDGYGIDNLSIGAPTPIPGAIWLLGSGLVGLVGLRRRFA